MSNHSIFFSDLLGERGSVDLSPRQAVRHPESLSSQTLPGSITKAASAQTYYTIRFLVDRDRTLNAFRAYAYFRWVDDSLEQRISERSVWRAFIKRQQMLMDWCYDGAWLGDLSAEETLLVDLIRSDRERSSGLQSYIHNMMAVMAFDADRRGRLISQDELTHYTQHLSTGVTDALHYFIGHDDPPPHTEARYSAVTGAHITHLLRDTIEDIATGYYNVPREYLKSHGIGAWDVHCDAYRSWVQNRVQLARSCFAAGKDYLGQVRNFRCRIAGFAYTARFETVLDEIEKDDYYIRPQYTERNSLKGKLKMSRSLLSMMFNHLVRAT